RKELNSADFYIEDWGMPIQNGSISSVPAGIRPVDYDQYCFQSVWEAFDWDSTVTAYSGPTANYSTASPTGMMGWVHGIDASVANASTRHVNFSPASLTTPFMQPLANLATFNKVGYEISVNDSAHVDRITVKFSWINPGAGIMTAQKVYETIPVLGLIQDVIPIKTSSGVMPAFGSTFSSFEIIIEYGLVKSGSSIGGTLGRFYLGNTLDAVLRIKGTSAAPGDTVLLKPIPASIWNDMGACTLALDITAEAPSMRWIEEIEIDSSAFPTHVGSGAVDVYEVSVVTKDADGEIRGVLFGESFVPESRSQAVMAARLRGVPSWLPVCWSVHGTSGIPAINNIDDPVHTMNLGGYSGTLPHYEKEPWYLGECVDLDLDGSIDYRVEYIDTAGDPIYTMASLGPSPFVLGVDDPFPYLDGKADLIRLDGDADGNPELEMFSNKMERVNIYDDLASIGKNLGETVWLVRWAIEGTSSTTSYTFDNDDNGIPEYGYAETSTRVATERKANLLKYWDVTAGTWVDHAWDYSRSVPVTSRSEWYDSDQDGVAERRLEYEDLFDEELADEYGPIDVPIFETVRETITFPEYGTSAYNLKRGNTIAGNTLYQSFTATGHSAGRAGFVLPADDLAATTASSITVSLYPSTTRGILGTVYDGEYFPDTSSPLARVSSIPIAEWNAIDAWNMTWVDLFTDSLVPGNTYWLEVAADSGVVALTYTESTYSGGHARFNLEPGQAVRDIYADDLVAGKLGFEAVAALDRSLFIEPLIEFTRDLCFLVSMFDNDTRFDGNTGANLASATEISAPTIGQYFHPISTILDYINVSISQSTWNAELAAGSTWVFTLKRGTDVVATTEYTFDRPYEETGGEACASFEIDGLDVTWADLGATGTTTWHAGDKYSLWISRPDGETADVKVLSTGTGYPAAATPYPGWMQDNAFTVSVDGVQTDFTTTDLVFVMQTAVADEDERTITTTYTYNTLATTEKFIFSGADGDSWIEAQVIVEPEARIRTDPRAPPEAFVDGGMIYWYDANGDGRYYEVGFVFTSDSKAHVDGNGDPAPVAIGFFIDYNNNHRFDAADSFFKTTWLNTWDEYSALVMEKAEYDAWDQYCKQFDAEYWLRWVADIAMGIAINIATRGQGKTVQMIVNAIYGIVKGAVEVTVMLDEANANDYARAVSISRRTDWGWIQGDFFVPEYPYSNIPIAVSGVAGPLSVALPRMSFDLGWQIALEHINQPGGTPTTTGAGDDVDSELQYSGINEYNVWQAGFMRLLQEMRIPNIDLRWFESASSMMLSGLGSIPAQLKMWKQLNMEMGADNFRYQGIDATYLRHVLHAGFRMHEIPDVETAIETGIHDAFGIDFNARVIPRVSSDPDHAGEIYYEYVVNSNGALPWIDATHPAVTASAELGGTPAPGGLAYFVNSAMLPTRWYRPYGLSEVTWGDALDATGRQDGTGFFDYAAAPIPVSIPYLLDYNIACLASAYETAHADYAEFGLGQILANLALEMVATMCSVAATTAYGMSINPNLVFLDKSIMIEEFFFEFADGLVDEIFKEAAIKALAAAAWNIFDQVVLVRAFGVDDQSDGWQYYRVIRDSVLEEIGENLDWGNSGTTTRGSYRSRNNQWIRTTRASNSYMVDRYAAILSGSQRTATRNLEAMITYLQAQGATDADMAETIRSVLVMTRCSFITRIRQASIVHQVMARAGMDMNAIAKFGRDVKARLDRHAYTDALAATIAEE
ncbi:MAG: hypothetical protein GYA24_23170, partial [Candidatus Lokiarchaeota archaeon]|nr:hypothetical protein [Candidatus Lokiarchaeota archaeon]